MPHGCKHVCGAVGFGLRSTHPCNTQMKAKDSDMIQRNARQRFPWDVVLSTSLVLSRFPCGRHCYDSHFTDVETEAQRA